MKKVEEMPLVQSYKDDMIKADGESARKLVLDIGTYLGLKPDQTLERIQGVNWSPTLAYEEVLFKRLMDDPESAVSYAEERIETKSKKAKYAASHSRPNKNDPWVPHIEDAVEDGLVKLWEVKKYLLDIDEVSESSDGKALIWIEAGRNISPLTDSQLRSRIQTTKKRLGRKKASTS